VIRSVSNDNDDDDDDNDGSITLTPARSYSCNEQHGVMMYRCLHSQAPGYLADHLTPASEVASRLRLRSANRHQLIVPRCRLRTYDRRVFSIAGPTIWNSLPDELTDPARIFDSLRQFLQTILFSLY